MPLGLSATSPATGRRVPGRVSVNPYADVGRCLRACRRTAAGRVGMGDAKVSAGVPARPAAQPFFCAVSLDFSDFARTTRAREKGERRDTLAVTLTVTANSHDTKTANSQWLSRVV